MEQQVFETNIKEYPLINRGKVRDMYDLGDAYLMVVTDRLSAFDVVLPDPIPQKGKVLTRISLFWFKQLESIIENHVITSNVGEYPRNLSGYADLLRDRSMIVKKAKPLPVECVVRGYISGSGWNSYKKDGTVCGIKLPEGLLESDKLDRPLFTPSTKAEQGLHDENIDFDKAAEILGRETAEKVSGLSLDIYNKGVEVAKKLGIIIADTKFEFGLYEDKLILIDEVMTPDSSRFWPLETYKPGGAQKSFDKQYVRDYLLTLDWDKTPPGPKLPEEVIIKTSEKYLEALRLFSA
jgi:phosphoribosylaminoimidazole-succinocarboxamide synthase